jgi:hypothetical protein
VEKEKRINELGEEPTKKYGFDLMSMTKFYDFLTTWQLISHSFWQEMEAFMV